MATFAGGAIASALALDYLRSRGIPLRQDFIIALSTLVVALLVCYGFRASLKGLFGLPGCRRASCAALSITLALMLGFVLYASELDLGWGNLLDALVVLMGALVCLWLARPARPSRCLTKRTGDRP